MTDTSTESAPAEYEKVTDAKYTIVYRRPDPDREALEITVQAFLDWWRVDMEYVATGDGKMLNDRLETREDAIEFAHEMMQKY